MSPGQLDTGPFAVLDLIFVELPRALVFLDRLLAERDDEAPAVGSNVDRAVDVDEPAEAPVPELVELRLGRLPGRRIRRIADGRDEGVMLFAFGLAQGLALRSGAQDLGAEDEGTGAAPGLAEQAEYFRPRMDMAFLVAR